MNTGSKEAYTLAVIGDTPYGPEKLAEFPALTALMNSDPTVDIVVHLGDIKAGSARACTDEYFAMIRSLFDQFNDPFVYTPGDNEWTDCHVASKNNGLYTPTERPQAVRSLTRRLRPRPRITRRRWCWPSSPTCGTPPPR
jgi:hypothetical protein